VESKDSAQHPSQGLNLEQLRKMQVQDVMIGAVEMFWVVKISH
jgi:hypothetical protein